VKFLLLLFLSFNSFAIDQKIKEISAQSFQVYVRPQVVNIYQDIQNVFLSFPGYPPEAFQNQQSVDQLLLQTDKLQALCPDRLSSACIPQLNLMLENLRTLERNWLHFEARAGFNADATIGGISGRHRWLSLYETTIDLKNRLEIEIIAIGAKRPKGRWSTWEVRKFVQTIENMQDLMIIDFIPGRLQKDFRQAWMNFFRPLYKRTILLGQKSFVSENLTKLNFYWNILNMKLTKKIRRTPEGMLGSLNAIQNRWNQILRIYFG